MREPNKRLAVLSPIAWRTPPRQYGAWETVASNITEGLVARGWDVTLFASRDSVTRAHLHAVVDKGYEEDATVDPKVAEYLHISEAFERSAGFDLIHSHYDFMALTYTRLIRTPVLTTIHGFSSKIMPIYQKYRDGYFVSVSDSDRATGLNYLATVYNGIDLSSYPLQERGGDDLVFLGRIHPDKGVHLAIEVARLSGMRLIIAGIVQDKAYFREQIKPHLDDQSILYIGPVDVKGKNELFARARALLHLNTIPERFGLVLVEANAAGVPVIAMDLGSCREVIKDAETGFLVANVAEAVRVLERISEIDRRACRRRVQQHFSIDTMVEGYERVYSTIFDLEAKRRS
jgi:glycosyltransferase involved in cell wall biosynthesis